MSTLCAVAAQIATADPATGLPTNAKTISTKMVALTRAKSLRHGLEQLHDPYIMRIGLGQLHYDSPEPT